MNPVSLTENRSVLVIDDDDFQLEFISDLLSELEVGKIITASDGCNGLKIFDRSTNKPDLILCDIQMPGLDGFELMKEFGDRAYPGGMVLMSGQGAKILYSASLVAQLARLNFLGTLEKPLNKHALKTTLLKIPGKAENKQSQTN